VRSQAPGSSVLSRRRFLALLGGALGIAFLGGCSDERTPAAPNALVADPDSDPLVHEAPSPTLRPPSSARPLTLAAQVCVVGGGAAGMAAATTAARQGASTLLLEQSYKLGGNVTLGLVNLDKVAWGGPIMVGGYFDDLIRAIELEGHAVYPSEETAFSTPCDPGALERMALRMALGSGAEVRLGTQATAVERDGPHLQAVWAQSQGESLRITAEVFVDATGDGHLGYLAGHPYWLGDPVHGRVQGQTLVFWASPVNWGQLSDYVVRHDGIADAYRALGLRSFMHDLRTRGETLADIQGGMLVNRNLWPEMVSISASETYQNHLAPQAVVQIMRVLCEQNQQIHQALVAEVPGFRDSRIIRIADRPYLREGRRLVGRYQLCLDDIRNTRKPADSVARGWYPVDLHMPDGTTQQSLCRSGEYYGIPYRCLVARDLDNLLMAGRCISVTHAALGSTRISPVSMSLGQAAGIAASLCARNRLKAALVPVSDIQDQIEEAGGLI
jgi:FAD dependent oxidoreductase